MSSEAGFSGLPKPTDYSSEFNAQAFLVSSLLSKVCVATVVRVVGVTNSGGVSAPGTVDIIPLVNLLDADNNAMTHGAIYRCPYQRAQGGSNAIIMDPQVDDIGIAIFADRDISSVVKNRGQANPGSRRRFDWADAMYIGGLLNGAPTQYVQFSDAGITIHSPAAVKLQGPSVDIECQTLAINATTSAMVTTPSFRVNGATMLNGPVSQVPGSQGGGASAFDGPVTVTNDVTAAGKSLSTHTHGGVQPGAGNSAGPN